jgi:hypothetical protein
MTRSIDQVIDLLPKLTAGERQDVIERCKAFNAVSGDQLALGLTPKAIESGDDALIVAEVIVEVLEAGGFEFTNTTLLRRKSNYATFAKNKVPGVMKFVRENIKKRVAQRALLVLGYEGLLQQLAQMKLAPTSTTLMNHTHRVPAIIQGMFPGYSQNGVLEKLFQT